MIALLSNKMPKQNTNKCAPITLDEVEVGASCVIVDSSLPEPLGVRLAEMGLTVGAEVTVLKKAPLGDPLEIRVLGYSLCIRKETARGFAVRTL